MFLNPYRFGIAPGVGLIDAYTTSLWGAYGLQLLRTSFGGSAIRVRRSSDSTEQDIGFTGSALNVVALLAFVGAGDGFVTKWYDQSGGGNDMVQATSGAQPQIVDAGAYMGEITLDGVDDCFNTTASSGTPPAFTVHFGGRHRTPPASLADRTTIFHAGSSVETYLHTGIYNSNYGSVSNMGNGGVVTFPDTQTNDENAVCFKYDRAGAVSIDELQFFSNGVSNTGTLSANVPATGNFTAGVWRLGWNGTARFAHLACKSLLIYETAQSSGDIASVAALVKPVPAVNTLDSYTTSLWGLYSMRKQRTAYAGSCLRVRRSSDSTEQDIGFTGAGFLDVSAMLTFVGAGSGFIRTWYDQSAGGNHIGQATAANQPRIVNSGVYDGAIVFDATNDYLITVNNSGTPTGSTAYLRHGLTASATTQVYLEHDSGGANNYASFRDAATTIQSGMNEASTGKAYVRFSNMPVGQVLTHVLDRTLSGSTNIVKAYSGGTALTGTSLTNVALSGTTMPAKQWSLGSRNGTLPAAGSCRDLVIYEAAHAAATVERISRAIG
jgi:hypothetical protein